MATIAVKTKIYLCYNRVHTRDIDYEAKSLPLTTLYRRINPLVKIRKLRYLLPNDDDDDDTSRSPYVKCPFT